jgi:translocation and assembly module TamB
MRRHWRALTLLLLLGGFLYALLATPLGLQLVYQVARTYAPGELQVQRLQGRWLGPLQLDGVRYRQDDQDHAIDTLYLDWRPAALLRGTFELVELGVQGVALELGAGAAAGPEPEDGAFTPDFTLPLGVRIGSLDIREVRITRQGAPLLQLDHIHLQAQTAEDKLQLGALVVELPQGRLELGGSIGLGAETPTDLDLRWSAEFAQLEPLKGKARLSGDWRRLQLDYQVQEPAPAQLQLQLDDPFGALHWNLALQLPEVALRRFAADWPELRLAARLEAGGDLRQASLQAELQTDAGAENLYPLKLQARARHTGDGWRLEQARLEQPDSGGVLEAHGQGVYGGLSELQLQWQALRWPPLPTAALAQSPQGSLDWSGTPDAWRYRLEGRLLTEQAPELTLQLAGTGNGEGARLETLHLALLDSTLEGEGAVHWLPEPRWELALRAERLDPAHWALDWPGRLAADLQVSGGRRETVLYNRLRLSRLEGELRGHVLQGQGLIVQEGDRLEVEGLELRSGDAQFSLQGRLDDQWRAEWRLDIPRLAELLPGGQGRLAGVGSMSGPRRQPRVQARVEGAGLAWETHGLETLALDLDWDAQGRWDLRLDATGLRSGTRSLASLTLGVQGSQAQHSIELAARREDADLALTLAGSWDGSEWQGQVRQADWRHERLGAWSLARPAALRASARGGALEALCWQREDTGLCLTGAGDREGGWAADLALERLPLAWLEPFLPLQQRVEGQLDAKLAGRFRPDGRPLEGELELALSPGRLILGPAEDQRLAFGGGRLQGRMAGARAELGLDLALAGDDRLQGDWRISGLDTDRPVLEGRLQGSVHELALVEAFIHEVEQVQGHLRLDIHTRGDLADPEISGRLDLEDGAVTVPVAGIRLEALQLALVAEQGGRILLTGAARSGREGELRLEGELHDVQVPERRRLRLQLQGERFLVVDTPEYRVRLDPDLVLEVEAQRVELTGELRVPHARLRPRDFSGAVAPSRDVVLVGADIEPEPPSPWRIHSTLQLYLGDDVQVNGFGLRGFIGGSLRLQEVPERPTTARGVLAIRDGRYRAYGQDLHIETGRLLYTDSPLDNPGLDIRAARHVSGVVAGIRVSGQLRDPNLSLYSDPAMSESDALSYLLFGRPLTQASGAEGAAMMQAASALGMGGGGLLAAQIGEAFGFDEVEIGGGGGGFEEAALMVGKYLSPRLYVQYSVGLLEPISTFRVRYEMSRRWTLQTETGVESGADLLFTLD